uniref:C3HC-type domain-containing protein n=1 Tax=Attheya septentrionalis TaxID=420275 RepID=A0A7S2UKA2_9STRA|mmetsp:Transcript_2715/g.4927  ORF Transcript_2715/g.4927 Transcript_2715/m.4927 type:complete len:559 (+) Transcript_2715:45-1721(+)
MRESGGTTQQQRLAYEDCRMSAEESSKEGTHLLTSIESTVELWCKSIAGGSENNSKNDTTETSKDVDVSPFSPEAYRKRLMTFRPTTYFAKPAMVSPLLCARFGWTNLSSDLLICSHSACGAAICVNFHPALSAKSTVALAQNYRKELATAHGPPGICPFRVDAEHWLLQTPSDKYPNNDDIQSNTSVVPTYLSSVFSDDQLVAFEDSSLDAIPTIRLLREKALTIDGQFGSKRKMRMNRLPQEVIDYFTETIDSQAGDIIDTSLSRLCDILNMNCGYEALDPSRKKRVSKGAALLAVFGWSAYVETEETTSQAGDFVTIQCETCLARTQVATHECRSTKSKEITPTNATNDSQNNAADSGESTIVDELAPDSDHESSVTPARLRDETDVQVPLDDASSKIFPSKRKLNAGIAASSASSLRGNVMNKMLMLLDDGKDLLTVPPPSKKRKQMTTRDQSSTIAAPAPVNCSVDGLTVDLLKSHRFFCPWACGFEHDQNEVSSLNHVIDGSISSRAGWRLCISRLLRLRTEQISDGRLPEDKGKDAYNSVQDALKSAICID